MNQIPVHILMATYNGASFLREQLTSIARQGHKRWQLTVSDDGSSDETVDLLRRFASDVKQPVNVMLGPGRGATRNFMHLISQVQPSTPGELFAFADQDDVWLNDKLERAVQWHEANRQETVRLYCARTRHVDVNLRVIGESLRLQRAPCLGNALVQNIASGNTMVFSLAVLQALQKIQPEHSVWHDWTTYLTTTALQGIVHHDETPVVLYRQHALNVIGANNGWRARWNRLPPVLRGRYRTWSQTNLEAMADIHHLLPETSRHTLEVFERMRNSAHCSQRINSFLKSGVRRQSRGSNMMLLVALMLKLV